MRGKYFKLKLFLLLSLIFCIVGGGGSAILISKIYSNSTEYIRKNIKMVNKEIYRSKEKIEVLDLTKFSPKSIIVEKSTDGENSIEVYYNENIKKVFALNNKRFNEKLDIIQEMNENYKNNSLSIFSVVERSLNNVIRNQSHFLFYSDLYSSNAEKIVVKLTEPTELIVNPEFNWNSYYYASNIDDRLIKRELNYKYYENNILNSSLILNGEVTLKDYGVSELRVYGYGFGENLNISVEPLKMKNFTFRGNSGNINLFLDSKNVEGRVELNIDSISGNAEVKNANDVTINVDDNDYIEYVIKYKDDLGNKEYVIPSRYKAREKKTIVIDANTVNYNNGREIIKLK